MSAQKTSATQSCLAFDSRFSLSLRLNEVTQADEITRRLHLPCIGFVLCDVNLLPPCPGKPAEVLRNGAGRDGSVPQCLKGDRSFLQPALRILFLLSLFFSVCCEVNASLVRTNHKKGSMHKIKRKEPSEGIFP
jgi:hypothetical protein